MENIRRVGVPPTKVPLGTSLPFLQKSLTRASHQPLASHTPHSTPTEPEQLSREQALDPRPKTLQASSVSRILGMGQHVRPRRRRDDGSRFVFYANYKLDSVLAALDRIEPGLNHVTLHCPDGTVRFLSRSISLAEIKDELLRAGIEPNPGPKKPQKQQKKKQPRQAMSRTDTRSRQTGLTRMARAIPRGTGAAIGGVAGSYFGMPAIGAAAGQLVSDITGVGRYDVGEHARLTRQVNGNQNARISSSSDSVTIRHREYLGDLVGSENFQFEQLVLNPSNPEVFPWASHIARNFTRYRFKQLVVEYVTTSSNYAANQSLGTVTFATNLNPVEDPWPNLIEMQSAVGATSTIPSSSMLHGVECSKERVTDWKLVRDYDQALKQGLSFYDWGFTQIATQGQTGANNLGQIWISYNLELSQPVANKSSGIRSLMITGDSVSPVELHYPGLYQHSLLFNGSRAYVGYNTTGSLCFRRIGVYLINLTCESTNTFISNGHANGPQIASLEWWPTLPRVNTEFSSTDNVSGNKTYSRSMIISVQDVGSALSWFDLLIENTSFNFCLTITQLDSESAEAVDVLEYDELTGLELVN